jgi:predicted Zn-dependent peptidase
MTLSKLNRKEPPEKRAVRKVELPKPSINTLPNGAKLAVINAGTQDIVKMEVIFNGGTRYQRKILSAQAAVSLMCEGTTTRNSNQIAEQLDYYGSFLQNSYDRDFASVSLFTTRKHFAASLEVVADILINPTYPKNELDIFRKKGKQSLTVELEKVETLAKQGFFQCLFGPHHPYGNFATPDDFDKLSQPDVADFHRNFHTLSNSFIILAGRVDELEVKTVETLLGANSPKSCSGALNSSLPAAAQTPREKFTYKDNAIQSAVRIGTQMVRRNHPDYIGLMVLNTILGGYFGSRLMQNLREDKGFTYGISSILIPYQETSVFMISTEVGREATKPAVEEIYNEIDKLVRIPVPAEELDLVKSQMIGDLLRTLDGPLAIADIMAGLYQYNDMDLKFLDHTIETINTITPNELQSLAIRYLNPNEMVVSVAGMQPF